MTKPELGTKRLCARCGARFYDLLHSPITCPKCGTVLAAADMSGSRVGVKAKREPERDFVPAVAGATGTTFGSPTDVDGEADDQQELGVLPDAEDDDDEDLDGAVLIEDSEEVDGEVTEVHRKEEE
jgi:uncharacterized protein (TIGR02300 family)